MGTRTNGPGRRPPSRRLSVGPAPSTLFSARPAGTPTSAEYRSSRANASASSTGRATTTKTFRRARSASTSAGTRTRTSASVETVHTSVSAPTWRAAQLTIMFDTIADRLPEIESAGAPTPPVSWNHEWHRGDARAIPRAVSSRGGGRPRTKPVAGQLWLPPGSC